MKFFNLRWVYVNYKCSEFLFLFRYIFVSLLIDLSFDLMVVRLEFVICLDFVIVMVFLLKRWKNINILDIVKWENLGYMYFSINVSVNILV